jgi:hypothetical protein
MRFAHCLATCFDGPWRWRIENDDKGLHDSITSKVLMLHYRKRRKG